VIALVIYGAVFRWAQPWLLITTFGRLTRDVTEERRAFFVRVLLYAGLGVVLISLNILFDYARIRIVVEDRRSAIGALLAAARFLRRHAGSASGVYALNAGLFLMLMLAYALLARGAAPAGVAGWLALGVSELYILSRHYLKLAFCASQTALFQSRLAHAGYTAAPPLVWPESPAAETIVNTRPLPHS